MQTDLHWRGPRSPAQVRAHCEPARERLGREQRAAVDLAWREACRAARAAGRTLFDGELLRLDHFEEKQDRLELTLSPVRYRDFHATQLHAPPALRGLAVEQLAQPVGTSAIVTSADHSTWWFGRRSERVSFHARHLHCFGGMLEISDLGPDGSVDVFRSILRELEEELGLREEHLLHCRLLGLVADRALRQPELVFEARLGPEGETRLEGWRSALHADEHTALIECRGDDRAPDRIVARQGPVAPVAFAAARLLWEEIVG